MVNAARTMMFALGCVQSRSCNTNACPTGIATQNPTRSKALNVEKKHQRVSNFQHATVHSCMELVGAMGLENPDDLTPKHILRRIDDETTKHYDEIYIPLQENELLNSNIGHFYGQHWQQASSASFAGNS
jgi:hypothetical protein